MVSYHSKSKYRSALLEKKKDFQISQHFSRILRKSRKNCENPWEFWSTGIIDYSRMANLRFAVIQSLGIISGSAIIHKKADNRPRTVVGFVFKRK